MSFKRPIAFALYKDGELVGYRQCTMGTIGDRPKIYSYDTETIQAILKNISWNVTERRPGIVNALKARNARFGAKLANVMRSTNTKLKDLITFEVRVLECPAYEFVEEHIASNDSSFKWPVYPYAAMEEWKQYPETHVVVETHNFGPDGLITNQ